MFESTVLGFFMNQVCVVYIECIFYRRLSSLYRSSVKFLHDTLLQQA